MKEVSLMINVAIAGVWNGISRRKKWSLLSCFVLLSLFSLFSPLLCVCEAGCKCKGVVYDGDTPANPLHSVKVEALTGKAKTVYTDEDGEFELKVTDLDKCSKVKVKVTANTLNGVKFSEEATLDDSTSPKKIYIKDYQSCKCDPVTKKYELFLHDKASGARPLRGRRHEVHILKRRSPHYRSSYQNKRYIAEVSCLQVILDQLGFQSGEVTPLPPLKKNIKLPDGTEEEKEIPRSPMYKPSTMRKFVDPPKKNKAGVYDRDEELAVLLFQSTALRGSPSDSGKLVIGRSLIKCKSKAFGSFKVTPGRVDKETLKALNKANKGNKDWPWKWTKFKSNSYLKRKSWKKEAEWGTKILMDVLNQASQASGVKSKGGIEIGDISRPTGGTIPGHSSHERGVDVDINMRDTDGKFGEIEYDAAKYDQEYAKDLLNALAAHPNVKCIFFHDPDFLRNGPRRSEITKGAGKIICAGRAKPGDSNYHATKPCNRKNDSHTHHIHLRVVVEKQP
jgi:penicillin-insensitive murein endopeptidase